MDLSNTNTINQYQLPKVTVITVVFNDRINLETTLLSVINQNYPNLEYLIIDGGSTDGTIEIIKKYEDKITNWISEPDKGIYDAMNKGVQIANGDWIIFMNCGDVFNGYNILTDVFNRNFSTKPQIIYGNYIIKRDGKKIIPPQFIKKSFFIFDTICHQTLFAKTEIFKKTGNFNCTFNIVADKDWLIRNYEQKIVFQYVNIDICIWDPIGYSFLNLKNARNENKKLQKKYFWEGEILFAKIVRRLKSIIKKKTP